MVSSTIVRFATAILAGAFPFVHSLPHAESAYQPAHKALSTVYEFQQEAWIENLRVRDNGNVLLTRYDNHPRLYEIDPSEKHPTPRLLAEFPQYARDKALSGITEIRPDVFAFIVGPTRYDQANHTLVLRGGTIDIYTIDLNLEDPEAQLLTTFEGGFINGFSTLPGTTYGLASDSTNGVIYRIDFKTGKTTVAIQDFLLSPPADASIILGINGLQINEKGTIAYFANSARGIMASIPINPRTGSSTGEIKVLATMDLIFDDFAVGKDAIPRDNFTSLI
ncbi:hypothetical protein G7Z17_g5871 [Cylindrodendrum hubeiense]|uniref:Uncharacterized protein n=1 Tax=Cylindrodendrum hubeiense TaxID=595255 RepID=A0A9P5HA40_9HYPO|nr:hypothetical protein G7Z17_g5871 [Cylindrodendrum hubeiense]